MPQKEEWGGNKTGMEDGRYRYHYWMNSGNGSLDGKYALYHGFYGGGADTWCGGEAEGSGCTFPNFSAEGKEP